MSMTKKLKGLLATLFLQEKEEQKTKDGVDDLFSVVEGEGYVYQVVRVDQEHMYALVCIEGIGGVVDIVIKTKIGLNSDPEVLFISSVANNTIH